MTLYSILRLRIQSKVESSALEFTGPTSAEVYVRSMLVAGKGLACWHPKPRRPYAKKGGVVPGDVGIYSASRGFEKIFHLWEDGEGSVSSPGRISAPPMDIVTHEEEFSLGDIVAQGTTSTIEFTSDGE